MSKRTSIILHSMRKTLHLVLLLLWLVPVSCVDRGQIYRYGGDPPLSTEHLDTLRQPVYTVIAKPTIFERAFFTGTFLANSPGAK